MNPYSDIAIQDRDGRTIGIIEFKRGSTINQKAAIDIFKDHVTAGDLRGVRFYLLVTPESMFLWDLEGSLSAEETSAQESALPRFLQERMTDHPDQYLMLLATYEWLVRLTYKDPDLGDPAEKKLSDAGFIAGLQNAQFRFEPAA